MSPGMCPSRGLMESKAWPSPLIVMVGLSLTLKGGSSRDGFLVCLGHPWWPWHPSSVLGLVGHERDERLKHAHLVCRSREVKRATKGHFPHLYASARHLGSFVWHFALSTCFPVLLVPFVFFIAIWPFFAYQRKWICFQALWPVLQPIQDGRQKLRIVSHMMLVLLC